jgi:glycosyltransferase involved in cell wall biosynthesis
VAELLADLPATVALVSPRYPPAIGGVERHVAELARGLARRGVEVEVITTDPTGRLAPFELVEGIPVRRFGTIAHDGVFFLSPGLGRWLVANAGRYGLIHGHSYHTPLVLAAAIAARRSHRPFVLTPHYHGTGHTPARALLHRPYKLLGARVVHAARRVICVSASEEDLVQHDFGPGVPTEVIHNGVDVEQLLAVPRRSGGPGTLVLAVGRLETYKRLDLLANSVPALPADFRVDVVGDGPARPSLEAHLRTLGVEDRMTLSGSLDQAQLVERFRTADVFVSLSLHEAFGLTILEAAVAGAAVVATDLPAHREVAGLLPAGAVRLLPVEASPAELAAAIGAARADRLALEARGGLDPRAWAVPTWDGMAGRVLAAYRRAAPELALPDAGDPRA